MRLEEIQQAVGDDTAGIAAFHDTLNEYANACYEAYVAPSGTGVDPQRMQYSAERVTTALADGARSWEHAVDRLKSGGVWTDEFDRVVAREMARQIDRSDMTGREKATFKKLVRERGGARESIEEAVAMLPQLPGLMSRDEEAARAKARGLPGPAVEVVESARDACTYWILVTWMCWLGAIFVTTGTGGAAWPVFGVCAIPALIALYWCTR